MRTHPRLILQTETAAETKVSAAGSSVLRVADDVTDWRSAALHATKKQNCASKFLPGRSSACRWTQAPCSHAKRARTLHECMHVLSRLLVTFVHPMSRAQLRLVGVK